MSRRLVLTLLLVLSVIPVLTAAPARAGAAAGCSGAWFHPVTPTRAYDSGSKTVGSKAVKVSLAKVVPAAACAVVGTLSGQGAGAATGAFAYPVGSKPGPATLDLAPGRDASGAVTVGLGKKAGVDLSVASGTARLQLDVTGYLAAATGAAFVPRGPVRVLNPTSVPAGGTVTLTDAQLGVPTSATSAVLALTAGGGASEGAITAYAAGSTRPGTTALTVVAGGHASATATVALGAGGVTLAAAGGAVTLAADLHGWYGTAATGSLFATRTASPTSVTLGPGASADVTVDGDASPAAALVTLTATGATAATTVTAYPTPTSGTAVPATGTLAVDAGVGTVDQVAVPTSAAGQIRLHNATGSVTVTATEAGAYAARPGGNDVSFNQCDGSGTTTTLPPDASFGIVNPTAGGLANTAPASCLAALETWARSTGGEQFYLPLVDFGDQSALWRTPLADAPQKVSCTSTSSAPGCAYDYGWDQVEETLTAAGSDGTSRTWWMDVEPGDSGNPLWSVCASRSPASGCTAQPQSQNAEVIAGALAYLRAHVPAEGIYSNAGFWSQLVGSATVSGEPAFSTYPEWYTTAQLTRAQEVGACTTPFAGGVVSLVQSTAPASGEGNAALDYDLHC